MKRVLVLLIFLLFNLPVQARQMVLVHGFSSGPQVWYHSGFVAVLQQAGWADCRQAAPVQDCYLPAVLPYRAPLAVQAQALQQQLQALPPRQPDEPLWLVGHSLGGVVARMVLLQFPNRVQRLITIASPNLGLPLAEPVHALNNWTGPAGDIMAAFMPGPLADLGLSDGLMRELSLYPGTALDWLNHQPHPPLEYVSLIHTGEDGPWLRLVPPLSQDLNAVPPLQGKARSLFLPVAHALHPADAQVVLSLP